MVQFYDEIPPFLLDWLKEQKIFWVASAPLSADGHVNVSAKGVDGTFHIVDKNRVWYEDLTGSGCETISHLRENGRVTIYFNAFEGPPRICRLFGKGVVHEFGTPEYNALIPLESRKPGSRSVIMVDVHKVASSCGYAVPFFDFKAERSKLLNWATDKEAHDTESSSSAAEVSSKGLKAYWEKNNRSSLDGLPGMNLLPVTIETCFATTGKEKKDGIGKNQPGPGIVFPVDQKLILGFVLGVLTAVVGVQLRSSGVGLFL
ncbi:hypothetical protein V5O48_016179 [Marasmius crinis-equi]|uniref:Pyridoxamine 5'-phosphate oxidase putative domain-containing protein n=1 Tax=Marasmius crinis-equi TaxID=585013 RepID=A0ABR3ESK8_9AGAR